MKFLRSFTATLLLLVATAACAADADRNGNGNGYEDVPSGTLILPGEREATGRESTADRKCMKVCKEWGETCIIDPRTGSRKCRRTCERFGVECF